MYASLNPQRHLDSKLSHLVQSILLLGGMALLLTLMGWSIAGSGGLLFAAIGMIVLLMGHQISPRVLLRMYRARPLMPSEAPGLYRTLQILVQRAELTMLPQLYYVPSVMMNAFTVGGRDHAAIAVTDGLVRGLSPRELTGVLAHEISHIRNNDTWVMSLAEVVSRLISVLSVAGQVLLFLSIPLMLLGAAAPPWLFLVLLITAPTISTFLQLALSRTHEFEADLDAARLTDDPAGLASALGKLERYQKGILARLFLPGGHLRDAAWLRTHPTTEERIRRLLALQDTSSLAFKAFDVFGGHRWHSRRPEYVW